MKKTASSSSSPNSHKSYTVKLLGPSESILDVFTVQAVNDLDASIQAEGIVKSYHKKVEDHQITCNHKG